MTTKGLKKLSMAAAAAVMSAGVARAQATVEAVQAGPAVGYTVVPVPERLTIGGVFADASIEMKLAFVILLISTLAALVVSTTTRSSVSTIAAGAV